MKGKHIVLAGNVGAGKTTLATTVSRVYGLPFYAEDVTDNPLLELCAQEPQKYAFELQHFFQLNGLTTHQQASLNPEGAVQDRSVYEHAEIFAAYRHAKGDMTDTEYKLYMDLYHLQVPILRQPDLVVYLQASVPVLLDRIQHRNRQFEKEYLDPNNNYIAELNERYNNWFTNYQGPKTIVESDQINYANSLEDFTATMEHVREALDEK